MTKTGSVFTRCQIFSIASTMLIGLGIFIFSFTIPSIMQSAINDNTNSQTQMKSSNQNMWGQLPGDSRVDYYRILTLYTPRNIMDVLFRGKNAQFTERPSVYSVIQQQQDINITFSSDLDSVSSNKQLSFSVPSGQNNTPYTVVNPAAFTNWFVAKNLSRAKLAWKTVGTIMNNLYQQLPLNLYCQALNANYFPNLSMTATYFSAITDTQKLSDIHSDTYFGIGSLNTMETWVYSAQEPTPYGPQSKLLQDYFNIDVKTFQTIRTVIQTNMASIMTKNFPYYQCNPLNSGITTYAYNCDGKYFAALQWGQMGVTNNPFVNTISAAQSIALTNTTFHQYIEIGYFYNVRYSSIQNYFINSIANYGPLTFDINFCYNFLNRNYEYPNAWANVSQSVLQNKGNIEFLYNIGLQYDATGNFSLFYQIQDRFKVPSIYHSHVLWAWIKQIEINFAYRGNQGGDVQYAAIGTLGSEAVYFSFRNLTEYLYPQMVAEIALFKSQGWGGSCATMINATFVNLTNAQISNLCTLPQFSNINVNTIKTFMLLCDVYGSTQFSDFLARYQLTIQHGDAMCSATNNVDNSIQTAINNANNMLKAQFACKYTKCSKVELAIKQWARGEVTQNPLISTRTKSYTISDWDQVAFPQPFEYGYFVNTFSDIFTSTPMVITDTIAKSLLNFRNLFNAQQITLAFIYKKANNPSGFSRTFTFSDPDNLLHYIRFATIQFRLGGATTQRTPTELFFGYADPYAQELKSRDPAGGADWGLNSWVQFGESNMTVQDAVPQIQKTGKLNNAQTRGFVSYNNSQFAIYNYSYFDGNASYTQWTQAWAQPENLTYTSDGIAFRPFVDTSTVLSVYVPQIYRALSLTPASGPTVGGLSTVQYQFNTAQLASQKKYENYWNTSVNLTTPKGAPIIVTFPHFYQSDAKLQQQVTFYDVNNNQISASSSDAAFFNVERYSGAPLQAMIQVMSSVDLYQDLLFFNTSRTALPILTLQNTGNYSSNSIYLNFNNLKMSIDFKNTYWGLITLFGLLFVCASIGMALFWIRQNNGATVLAETPDRGDKNVSSKRIDEEDPIHVQPTNKTIDPQNNLKTPKVIQSNGNIKVVQLDE